jgi:hypothetical protein
MHLRDNVSRSQMLRAWKPEMDSAGFDKHTTDLCARLLSNSFFSSLPEKQQKNLLKGESAMLLSQDKIVIRMGDASTDFRGMYRFLSAQVHSTPLAWYRMAAQNRGRGVENEIEKGYIALTVDYVCQFVLRASHEMVGIFPISPHYFSILQIRSPGRSENPY